MNVIDIVIDAVVVSPSSQHASWRGRACVRTFDSQHVVTTPAAAVMHGGALLESATSEEWTTMDTRMHAYIHVITMYNYMC